MTVNATAHKIKLCTIINVSNVLILEYSTTVLVHVSITVDKMLNIWRIESSVCVYRVLEWVEMVNVRNVRESIIYGRDIVWDVLMVRYMMMIKRAVYVLREH